MIFSALPWCYGLFGTLKANWHQAAIPTPRQGGVKNPRALGNDVGFCGTVVVMGCMSDQKTIWKMIWDIGIGCKCGILKNWWAPNSNGHFFIQLNRLSYRNNSVTQPFETSSHLPLLSILTKFLGVLKVWEQNPAPNGAWFPTSPAQLHQNPF